VSATSSGLPNRSRDVSLVSSSITDCRCGAIATARGDRVCHGQFNAHRSLRLPGVRVRARGRLRETDARAGC
jgi:hypothetical protein